jgi:hypothetical protein
MPQIQSSKLPLGACAAAASGYDRLRDLPRLLRLWPDEVRSLGAPDQPWLVKRLGRVLRTERHLGLVRHWSYDLSRHAALLRAWRTEKAELERAAPANGCLPGIARPAPK